MKRNLGLLLTTITTLTLMSCGSTKVKKLVTLPSLSKDVEVEILTKEPDFGYEIICDVTITRKGNFVSTQLEAYKSNMKRIVRDCGTKLGLLVRLSGTSTTSYSVINNQLASSTGHNIMVKGYAIRQTTEKMKITDKETVKKLVTAFSFGNTKVIDLLLKDVNNEQKMRSPYDEKVLQTILRQNASLGAKCNEKSIRHFHEKYNVKLSKLREKIGKFREASPGNLIYCDGFLNYNYENIKNKLEVAKYVHKKAFDVLKYYSGKRSEKKMLKIASVIPKISSDIKKACTQDETSELCLYRGEYQALKDMIIKIKRKNRKHILLDKVIEKIMI